MSIDIAGRVASMRRKAAHTLVVLGATLIVLLGVAQPAHAYVTDNIATNAETHVSGTWGGQCKAFVNGVVSAVTGKSLPAGSYQDGFPSVGAVEVSPANAVRGDIIQVTPAGSTDATAESLYNGTASKQLHTAIIRAPRKTDGTFDVIDSNWGNNELVQRHNFNPYTWASGSIIKIWRFGTPGSTTSGSSALRHSDVDKNNASDLILTTAEPTGGSAAHVLLSTWQGFWQQSSPWWQDAGTGWTGITPLSGDVNADGKADYVFAANAGTSGISVYVALSTGSSFGVPQLWWSGSQFSYSSTKFTFGDVDGNGADDLVLSVQQPDGSPAMYVMLSTWQGFWLQSSPWLTLSGWSWQDTTPLIGETNITIDPATNKPDKAADLVLLTNSASGNVQAWVGVSSRSSFVGPNLWWDGTGYGYSGIKPVTGDVDGNGADDLILTTAEPIGGSAAQVLLSTWQGFLAPHTWWQDAGTGWTGITPMVADVTGDGKADFAFLADGGTGSPVYVGTSTGSSFDTPQLWWSGTGYGYSGIKTSLR